VKQEEQQEAQEDVRREEPEEEDCQPTSPADEPHDLIQMLEEKIDEDSAESGQPAERSTSSCVGVATPPGLEGTKSESAG
jgi:hypothetical protein